MAKFEVAPEGVEVDPVAPQRVADGPVPVGIYKAIIKDAFIIKTEKGASMWHYILTLPELEDRELHLSTSVRSRAGKTTYEKNGKVFLLPGVQELVRVTKLLTGSEDIDGKDGKVKLYDDTVDGFVLSDLIGKKVLVGIRQYENFYNGNVSVRNMISHWMTPDGNNEIGEPIEEDVAKFLQRNPLKKLTGQQKPVVPAAATPAAAPTGW